MKIINWIKENKILVVILSLGAILRIYKLDYQSVWLDEIHTMNEANPNLSFSEVYHTVMSGEQMPPLYFYLLHFLFLLFGYTVAVARAFSAMVAIASLYSVYLLGKELANKQVGLIAALFLCVNPFHLYFSQEARPYMMLLLFSALSFYKLIRYIKNPNSKNALFYGLFSALMLHSHFFGLFALVSQMVILFFFLIVSEKQNRKQFLINSVLAGLVIAVLFTPLLQIFINITKIKDFWIAPPTPDSFTLIFKEFFGNSEAVLTILSITLIFYFIKLSKEKDTAITYESVVSNKTILSFVILIPWIVIVILIPLIRSHLSVPMIISRYFIVLLPAVFLLIGIALYQFKNRIILFSLISIFVTFSITDIVIVKKYYRTIIKSQFREVSQFVISNNTNKEPVITSLGWYFSYFLNNQDVKTNVVNKPLNEFISEMKQDDSKVKSFWYVDAHNNPYKPTDENQKFLDEKFEVAENITLIDAWAKHFVPIGTASSTKIVLDPNTFSKTTGDKIMFGVDVFTTDSENVSVFGWASFENQDATYSKIDLLLISADNQIIKLKSQNAMRIDVTQSSKEGFNLDNSGFDSKTDAVTIPNGKYQLGIRVTNKNTKKEGFVLTGRFIEK